MLEKKVSRVACIRSMKTILTKV